MDQLRPYWSSPKVKRWEKAISLIAIINFVAFIIIAQIIGGDALNGKIIIGHYFLWNKGRLTEVPEWEFRYSQIHAISMFCTHILAFVVWLNTRERLKRETDAIR